MKFTEQQVSRCFHGNEPWFNIFVLKYVTIPTTRFVANHTNLTPNHLTILSLFAGLMSAWSYAVGYIVLGALLYLISYTLDAIDGKLARLKGLRSEYGAWLDIAVDRIVFSSVAVALCYSQLSSDIAIFAASLLVFLFLFGFESRYNIQVHEIQNFAKSGDIESIRRWHPVRATDPGPEEGNRYQQWRARYGVVSSPVTLVEILIILFVISPVLGFFAYTAAFAVVMLLARIAMQQRYWLSTR
ncbi:CDP-alcohol phosphatidyltransferase family protein [Thalassorhabdomicrobium marinisediminis]|uniref:CDP-alcohol phosphatidyltransferase family protein n=1 Tax=Thalassorhabdomicrobium marinisediminis TaxID=2170577 RepID=A0A2T7FWD9_9RHOB|nr:CDP-alcohol phosphatidyltransferase family protein [Thalassorhabdomicrobium marinisediminis]PVA06479.1 hypothetical protein DC363_11315 [Thalassorhabdomicrobium marinisediminis]